MASCAPCLPENLDFWERCDRLASDHRLEGVGTAFWLGWKVSRLASQISESSPQGSILQKIRILWKSREVKVAFCSVLSAGSMFFSWAGRVGFLSFGPFGAAISCVGGMGAGYVSWTDARDQIHRFEQSPPLAIKAEKLCAAAFYVVLAARAVLGGIHPVTGGVLLCQVIDKSFIYAVYAFCGVAISKMVLPKVPGFK